LAVTNAGLKLEESVRSSVLLNEPDVTPSGNPTKLGVCVATPAVPVSGTAVGAWMCEAVVLPSRPLNVAEMFRRCETGSYETFANPVPGEATGGDSLGPSRAAVKNRGAACAAGATRRTSVRDRER
jgi:hypothetical protein